MQGLESLKITISNENEGQRQVKIPSKTTLNADVAEFVPKLECICERSKKLVICGFCGSFCHGRIVKICQMHPKATFEEDVGTCPICINSKFLTEHEIPMSK